MKRNNQWGLSIPKADTVSLSDIMTIENALKNNTDWAMEENGDLISFNSSITNPQVGFIFEFTIKCYYKESYIKFLNIYKKTIIDNKPEEYLISNHILHENLQNVADCINNTVYRLRSEHPRYIKKLYPFKKTITKKLALIVA